MATRTPGKSRRIGKTGEDIFLPRVESSDLTRPKKRGRRPSHTEHWTKVTVVLFDRQIVFLDRLGADIRAAESACESRRACLTIGAARGARCGINYVIIEVHPIRSLRWAAR